QAAKTGPSPRTSPAFAFDSLRGQSVLFGGNSGTVVLGETWVWDGSTWKQKTPAVAPSARFRSAMAFDPSRGRAVLFGGSDSILLTGTADTWEWDGATWTQRTPAHKPSARSGTVMWYDPSSNRVMLFGGSNNSITYNDLWSRDGSDWTQISVQNPPP